MSMLNCSEGAWGLSVPLRVPGVFTGTTISPSSWLRQRPDRYTIRAAMIHSSTLEFSSRIPVSVCGTGFYNLKLSGFSWKSDYLLYPRPRRFAVLLAFSKTGGFAYRSYTYNRGSVTTPSPHRSYKKYWNINQLSIEYPFRVLLRSRLTLIRLALIRKPYPFGGQVSRLPYRYLCLHLLFQKLHQSLRFNFAAAGMLPYRNINITHSFGVLLNARLLSMHDRSTSELLRTL
eukprot:gene12725-15553_t